MGFFVGWRKWGGGRRFVLFIYWYVGMLAVKVLSCSYASVHSLLLLLLSTSHSCLCCIQIGFFVMIVSPVDRSCCRRRVYLPLSPSLVLFHRLIVDEIKCCVVRVVVSLVKCFGTIAIALVPASSLILRTLFRLLMFSFCSLLLIVFLYFSRCPRNAIWERSLPWKCDY